MMGNLAGKISAQEMIKANTAAEAAHREQIESQNKQYEEEIAVLRQNAKKLEDRLDSIEDVLNDLAECKSNDRKIVTVESQNGDTDQETCYCCNDCCDDYAYDKTCSVGRSCHCTAYDNRSECTDRHKARMSERKLSGDTYNQVKGYCHHHVASNGNKLSLK